MTNVKKLIKTMIEINNLFISTNKPIFIFSEETLYGNLDLNKNNDKNYAISEININDLKGNYVVVDAYRSDGYNTQITTFKSLYKFNNNDFLLSDEEFKDKYVYLNSLVVDLLERKIFKCLTNINSKINEVLTTNNSIAQALNEYLLHCDEEQIDFLDKIGFNPLLLINRGTEYPNLVKTFEEKMTTPYVISSISKNEIDNKLYPFRLDYLYGYDISSLEKNSKFKNNLKEYTIGFKIYQKYQQPKNKRNINTKKIIHALSNYEKFTFNIKLKTGKAIKDKKPLRYIFSTFNAEMEENGVEAFFAHNVDVKEISLDMYIDKDIVEKYKEKELKQKINQIVIEIINSNSNTYKSDWGEENKYKICKEFLNENKKLIEKTVKKSKKDRI